MITKKLQILILSLCIYQAAFTADVNPENAKIIAQNFYAEKAVLFNTGVKDISINDIFIKSNDEIVFYYVFTFQDKGFVIVAAEDVLPPVLGYSPDGYYQNEDQPDSYRNFMQTYSDEITYIRSNALEQTAAVKALWEYYSSNDPSVFTLLKGGKSVEPLIPSKWNQSYPYNYLCPVDPDGSGGHVYAGCVATAMAQVMYYWRYPLQGTGSHSYYYPPYGTLSANFGSTTYEWEGMKNSIDHNNIGPIALLQYHCGIAVDMMYGPNGSGAYSNDVPPAMINYFNYSPDCYFTWKDDHTHTEWVNMLKNNLDNGWPMYYSGYSSAGGHAFVCDGYQDEYFHFNFGWSGSSDGYYTLQTVGGFNDGQGAVFDTYPESNYPYYCTGTHQITMISGSFEDGSGPVANYNSNTNCSWLFTPQTGDDSISSITLTFKKFDTEINDKVRIYDGSSTQDNLLGEFSGSEIPAPVTTTGNEMLVVFESDGSGTAPGWIAEYSGHKPNYCQGVTVLDDLSGTLSDGSGTFNYHNSSACMWKIMPEQAQSVTIHFTSFKTETIHDKVRIYDLESQEMLAEYSGNFSSGNLPDPVTSPSGKMFIAFSTNSSVTLEGWDATYTSVLTGIQTNPNEEETFRFYPNPASDMITVEVPESEGLTQLEIINITGKT
ncbi:MAG: hypothetical protein FJY07_08810, partial [Bacteroidetes bacterium]|nr:hypothetical protein [Bacteroidota bacterium]